LKFQAFKECISVGTEVHFLATDILGSKLTVWYRRENWVNVTSQTEMKKLILLETRE
jgi:hypothetical protein